jgi:hypothetical protein
MEGMNPSDLVPRQTPGAQVSATGPAAWRLSIPAGPAGQYRWAQLDNYLHRPRPNFPHAVPFHLRLRARVSAPDLPGTWGFGLWNDPFGLSWGQGGGLRLPALPNAAWFFYASPPNYLALRDTHPAQGLLAAVFRSPLIPSAFSLLAAPALPLLLFPPGARLLRRLASCLVREDAATLPADSTQWHTYDLSWQETVVRFEMDGQVLAETPVSPRGRLGLVLWIDNQCAAFPPDGRPRAGTLACPEPAWLDLELE